MVLDGDKHVRKGRSELTTTSPAPATAAHLLSYVSLSFTIAIAVTVVQDFLEEDLHYKIMSKEISGTDLQIKLSSRISAGALPRLVVVGEAKSLHATWVIFDRFVKICLDCPRLA
jgi:hypothetical protein